jgi:hypothetical protein
MEYEIDVTDVEAGTTVDQSECERILGIKRKGNEYNYQFALMQLAEFIQRSLWKIGKQFTVTTSAGQVNILTHEEASKYNESRFDLAISKMRRCNRRLNAVDIGSLSKDSRDEHGRAIIRQSRILSMLKTTNKDLDPEVAKKRVTLGTK